MKVKNFHKTLCGLLVVLAAFSSCKKESESTFEIFKGLTIDFNKTKGADEVYVEFNLSKAASEPNMSKVIVTETGGTNPVYTTNIDFTNRFSFAPGVLIFKTSDPANASYKITVLDEKGNDITSQVSITYPAGQQVVTNPVLITDGETATFEEGTTAYIDYTIHSENANIRNVSLESFPAGENVLSREVIAIVPDNATDKRNFRGATRVKLDRNGGAKFRLYAADEANDYIGDGYKYININVATGFELTPNRFVYAPNVGPEGESENLPFTAKCFYSILRKKAYTYEEAKAVSQDIDFGIYLSAIPNTVGAYYVNIYNMADPATGNLIIGKYDLSSWTKRETKYSIAFDGSNYNSLLISGSAIKAEAKKYAIFTTRKRVSSVLPGKVIYFITPEGKNGAILINNINKDYLGRWFVNFDVKIVK